MGDKNEARGASDAGDINGAGGDRGAAVAVKQSLWTRSFVVISFVNFLQSVVFLLLMIIMAKVATDRFGASPALAGLSASIFVIGSFAVRPFFAKRIHSIGQTRVLYVASFFSVVLILMYFVVHSNEMLLLVRFLHGAAHGTAALATGTIVAGVVPRERYGEGIGYFTLGQTLSTAIGPFVGILLIRRGGFDSIIITCSVLASIALLALPLLRVRDLQLTEEQQAVPVAVAVGLSYLCYSSVSSFLALYSEAIRLTGAATVFFIVYAIVVFVTRPLVGRRFDARGENSVMYAAIVVFAVGLAILAVAHQGAVLLLSAAVLGLGFGTIQTCGRAVTIKVTPLYRMGQATSTFYIFGDTGLGLGPLFCGLLIPLTGYRGMYGIMAVIAMVSVVLYHLLHLR